VRTNEVVLRVEAIQSDQNGWFDIREGKPSGTPRRMDFEGKGVIGKRHIANQ
jgi:hypothetical protein